MDVNRSIYLGFDPREAAAYAVARSSAKRRLTQPISIRGIVLMELQSCGLYRRPLEWREGPTANRIMWDTISDAPMSTQHACARFLVPHLAKTGWALFMDGDVLVRGNLIRIFEGLDQSKAIYCVKHQHMPPAGVKMDGQEQTRYARKNWSSVIVWNCDHPSNKALSLDAVNSLTGRDLHRFVWLEDEEIGELDPKWNWLVRQSPPVEEPQIVHFTEGTPDMPGYDEDPYTDEWRQELARWAAA
jgi:lipopolysaccharide biosynthesis glycosyltransferase